MKSTPPFVIKDELEEFADYMPPPSVMEAVAIKCSCCSQCWGCPCDGVMAGGLCDGMKCTCNDRDYDSLDYDDGNESGYAS
jgi:hypothetical protein